MRLHLFTSAVEIICEIFQVDTARPVRDGRGGNQRGEHHPTHQRHARGTHSRRAASSRRCRPTASAHIFSTRCTRTSIRWLSARACIPRISVNTIACCRSDPVRRLLPGGGGDDVRLCGPRLPPASGLDQEEAELDDEAPLIAPPAAAGNVHERPRLALLQRHQQLPDVIALAHAVVAQGVAVVP